MRSAHTGRKRENGRNRQREAASEPGPEQDVTTADAAKTFSNMFAILQKCFIAWNLQDDTGTDLGFTEEMFQKTCTQVDFLTILQAVTGMQLVSDQGRILSADEIAKKGVSA